ncbi:MAG: PilN domain-containing protein [marine benthic group bacterium]|nr:PilN domain-containing protein [Gemmatimonadota bacterium]MCL7969043.1 PilN domain-containing protein [Gemmatimonadota bacterium]MCL7978549.1 PilN domain-containing protein [Gemmatimonadota bacterium]
MIEVNLHPTGGRPGKRRRSGLSAPAWMSRGRGGPEGRDPWTLAAISAFVLAVLAIGGMWFAQRSNAAELEVRLEEAREDSTRLADLRVLSDSLIDRERQIRQRLELVRGLDEGRFVWPHLLDEISRALPEYTWLTAVRVETPLPELVVQLDGIAANPLAVTRFVRNLQSSDYLKQVRIMGSQQAEVENVAAQAFKLLVSYEDPEGVNSGPAASEGD